MRAREEPASIDNRCASIEDVLNLARTLGPEAQRKVVAELALDQRERKRVTVDARDLEMWSVAVSESLDEALGKDSYGDMLVRKQLAACWEPVATFMRSSKLADLEVIERQCAYRLLADMVVRRAAKVARFADTPLSLKMVGTQTGALAAIFDNSFPGYLASGLAPVVVRSASRK